MRKPSTRAVDPLAGKVPPVTMRDATKAVQVRSGDKVLIEIDGVISKGKKVFSVVPSALVRVHFPDGSGAAPPYRDVLVRAAEAKRNSVQDLAGKLFKGKAAAAGKGFSKFRLVIMSDATFDRLAAGPEPLFLQEPATMELEFTVSKGNSFVLRVPCRLRAEPAAGVFPQAGAALDAYFEDGECAEPGCHAHWHGIPFWTWWTSCHGNCGAGLDCRCKARPPGQRGFKVCQGWVFCNCV